MENNKERQRIIPPVIKEPETVDGAEENTVSVAGRRIKAKMPSVGELILRQIREE